MTDKFDLTSTTPPTVEEVQSKLVAGGYTVTAHGFTPESLSAQLAQTQPVVWEYRQELMDNDFPHTVTRLVEAYRFAEIGGFLTAQRVGIVVDTMEATSEQSVIRQRLIASADAMRRLARDAKVKEQLFSVRFGDGDAAHVLTPARTFLNLLVQYGPKVQKPKLVGRIVDETKADILRLETLEIDQETGKKAALVPSGTKTAATGALYEHLLHFSRAGNAVFRRQPEIRAKFKLKVLFPSGSGGAEAQPGEVPGTPGGAAPAGGEG